MWLNFSYKNIVNNTTKANNTTKYRINLHMYFNHVVYGTSKYVKHTIKMILVGPTIDIIP